MISFKEYAQNALCDAVGNIAAACEGADIEYLGQVIDSFSSLVEDGDVEVAFTSYAGCLLVRIFDMGRYLFVYPIPLSESADEDCAIDAVRLYAVKEELSLCFCDVPRDSLGTLLGHFRHASVDAEDCERASYKVSVSSEAALFDGDVHISSERISLSLISECDTAEYARLCRDETVNEYWGYYYLSDVGEVADSYFVDEAASEYNRGVSVTLGARLDGKFIGEATLHAFDLAGGCEIAFRLLPEYWGRGLGTELLLSSTELARGMGLCRVYARVMTENSRSDALLSRYMELTESADGYKKYVMEL